MWQRLIIFLIIFLCFLTLPWYIGGVLTLVALVLLPTYLEIILLGIILDVLFSANSEMALSVESFFFTFLTVALYLFYTWSRRYLRN